VGEEFLSFHVPDPRKTTLIDEDSTGSTTYSIAGKEGGRRGGREVTQKYSKGDYLVQKQVRSPGLTVPGKKGFRSEFKGKGDSGVSPSERTVLCYQGRAEPLLFIRAHFSPGYPLPAGSRPACLKAIWGYFSVELHFDAGMAKKALSKGKNRPV
jgi:hypothetical protein